MDATRGEQCDDGNRTVGDGCDLDCQYDCTSDDDCVSDDRCAPLVCNDTHACEAAAPVVCDDGDPCTIDGCEPESGCVATPADRDGDGYLVAAFGTCALPGGDCDDDDAGRHPGAEERCEDGDAIDDDCDPGTPSPRPSTWTLDCDGDGHPAASADEQLGCAPPPTPAGCTGIGWTSTPTETTDCDDHNEDVFPGQTSGFGVPVPGVGGYDYDCDGVETKTSLCGGNCSISYSSGTCWISPPSTCTGACGSRSVRVTSCSDAVYCRNVYTNGLVGCR